MILPDWLQWALGAPLWSAAAVVAGFVVLVMIRWVIRRGVRSVVTGGTRMRRKARRMLLRMGTEIPESDPLAIARRVQRAETMGSVLRSAAALIVTIVVVTVIANINNWDLGPILASAGVVGVALGFGAQTLVKDYLAGLFMLIEDQYGVGDVVDVGEVSGVVEAIGLRVTQIRDLSGTLWYVRNGEVLRVGNMTQDWSRAFIEVLVPPEADLDRATEVLRAVGAEVAQNPEVAPHLLEEAQISGPEELSGESLRLRLMIKVVPAMQWEVARVVRALIRDRFAAAGIPLSVPRQRIQITDPGAGSRKATPDSR